jgi:menaquinone-dependent protoporphyrinogen oxidase
MSKVLVAYATNSGSTGEVAASIAEELTRAGHSAEVKPITADLDVNGYDAVVVGAPMIFGWAAGARAFLHRNQSVLAGKNVALFACAMRFTQVPDEKLPAVSWSVDPNLAAEPQKGGSLSLKERFTTAGYYLKPMLAAAPAVKPVEIGFFNGKLEMFRLNWWQSAFVMIVVQGIPGDYRDWGFIRGWAKGLAGKF